MDYPTSKAGLMFGLTKSIAQYGSKYGIRCVCVSPGPVSYLAVREHDERAVPTQPTIKAAKAVRDNFDYMADVVI